MEYRIIEVDEKSKDKLATLLEWRRTGKEVETKIRAGEKVEVKKDGFRVFVAEVDNKFIGYISIAIIPKPDSRMGTLYVDELWVPEWYRRNGIAKALMDRAISYAEEMKMWRIRLSVSQHNEVGRSFYKNQGFIETDATMFCERSLGK